MFADLYSNISVKVNPNLLTWVINLRSIYSPMPFYNISIIPVAPDKKQHCASLFIDLFKAFHTVIHDASKLRAWSKYSHGSQTTLVITLVYYIWWSMFWCSICLPQGFVLGSLLFTIAIFTCVGLWWSFIYAYLCSASSVSLPIVKPWLTTMGYSPG